MKLRFSIRDLLWLTALAAVLVAWWIDHRGQVAKTGRTEESLRRAKIALTEKENFIQMLVWKTDGVAK